MENNAIPFGLLIDNEHLDYNALEQCDGFIIPGGNKIERFVYEIMYYAIKQNKPLVGICMGAEAIDLFSCINEYLDHTQCYNSEMVNQIYQQLKEQNDGTLLKRLEENSIHGHDLLTYDDYEKTLHQIRIEKDSIAYSILNKDEVLVPSMHHFDFKKVGKDFKVTARATDGVSEIIEYNKKDYFIIGVHFHAELMDTSFFSRLVKECLKRIK